MVHILRKRLQPKKPTKNNFLANSLIILGVLLILSTIVGTQYYKPLSALQGSKIVLAKNPQENSPKPVSLTLIGLTSEIPVKVGHFDGSSEWDLSKNEALYLESSGIPGQKGNIVIYGHNSKQVFSPLFDEKVGNLIEIKTDDGKVLNYKITQIKNVLPTDVEILSQDTKEEKLTIFTCSGLFDSMRLAVIAKRVPSSHPERF